MLKYGGRFVRSGLVGSGLAVCLWLSLALDGCSGSTDSGAGGAGSAGKGSAGDGGSGGSGAKAGSGGVEAGGKTTGGGGSAAGSGAGHGGVGGDVGGVAGEGGFGGEGGADSRPRVVSLEHKNGAWLVKLDRIEGLYTLTCSGDQPSLVEQDPPNGATSLPPYGQYYVDDEFFDIPPNLGCDFRVCEAFPAQIGISDVGYVSVAPRPRPGAGAGGEGGAGGEVPAFATYEIDGPFVLTNRFFTDDKCTKLVVRGAQVLTP